MQTDPRVNAQLGRFLSHTQTTCWDCHCDIALDSLNLLIFGDARMEAIVWVPGFWWQGVTKMHDDCVGSWPPCHIN